MLKRCACVQLNRVKGLGIGRYGDSYFTSYLTLMQIFQRIFGIANFDEFVADLVTSPETIQQYYIAQMWKEGLADQAR